MEEELPKFLARGNRILDWFLSVQEPDQSCFLCLSRGISDEVHQNDLEGSNGKDCYELMMQDYHNMHCRVSIKSDTIIFQA